MTTGPAVSIPKNIKVVADMMRKMTEEDQVLQIQIAAQAMQFEAGLTPITQGGVGEWAIRNGFVVHQPEPIFSEFGLAVFEALGFTKG